MRLLFSPELGVTGGYGRVFRARAMDPSQKLVAVKKCHVTDHVEHPRLQHEACALVLLQGHRAIPHVYAWGKSQFYEYLALELLDTVLSDLKGKLTLRNLAAIAHEVLEGLRFIHSHGIVHCDIKPANLMFGLVGAEPSRVRIIDFGICRPFRDPVTSVHRPDVGTPQSIGTEGYMSLNGHLHHSPWRRDDVESLSYVMLSLMASRLPWDARGKPRDRLSSRGSYALKKQWTGARLAGDLSVFGAFVDYARRLEYAQELDYGRWKEHFRALAQGTSDASDSDPLYDPLDTASGASVVVDADFELPEDVYRLALADPSGGDSDTVLPQSKTPPSLKGSLGRWRPAYTWEMAVPVEDDELLGDECEIVRTRLDAVDAVPEGQGYYLEPSCPPEVMRPALMKNPTAEWEKDSSKIGGAINSKESRPPLGELPL